MSLIVRAAKLADYWHKGQVRKYTNQPYITHPARVAHAVAVHWIGCESTVAAAYLHDVIEDCNISYDLLIQHFNPEIANLVLELTNDAKLVMPKANRRERKAYDLKRISTISRTAKIIKMFDRIDNLGEYPLNDEKATKFLNDVYLEESFQLHQVVKDADEELAVRLLDKINQVAEQIGGLNYYERSGR